ncbi:tyrosine-protein phosphatase [Streptomyces sp. NPDC050617]|uniref:tyrosine-protein phosphatase n=1 Tax=Streptomyces sp. NPDC050617 TaxID=3154628 RepID=UPI003436CDFE
MTVPSSPPPRTATGSRVVPGAPNARDLAGLRADSGLRVRPGLMYRGAGAAVGPLAGRAGLRAVLDLRDGRERAGGEPPPDVTVLSRPLVADRSAIKGGGPPQPSHYLAYYRQLARPAAPIAAELVGLLAGPAARLPLLVCCSAGKDRTSVVCALALRAVGVRTADLARDHALTGRLFRRDPDAARLLPWARGLAPYELAARTATPGHVLRELLSGLEREHGSVRRFLTDHGLRPETVRRARHVLLGDPRTAVDGRGLFHRPRSDSDRS